MKKVYIAGKITGLDNFKKRFDIAEGILRRDGHTVLNPTQIVPQDLEYEDQMAICMRLVEVADVVYMLDNWKASNGARREHAHAMALDKRIVYQDARG